MTRIGFLLLAVTAWMSLLSSPAVAMKLTSPSFATNGRIPAEHTCEGADTSPPLAWSDVPAGTKSLALVVDDPDAPDPKAPQTIWLHWIVYAIPPTVTALAAGASGSALPAGAREGQNDWKASGWRGPCPPVGRHRYFFKLYALDVALDGATIATRADLQRAMAGHVLTAAGLVGLYEKHGAPDAGR